MRSLLKSARGAAIPTALVLTGYMTYPSLVSETITQAKAESPARNTDFRSKWEKTVKTMQQQVCETVERIDGEGMLLYRGPFVAALCSLVI